MTLEFIRYYFKNPSAAALTSPFMAELLEGLSPHASLFPHLTSIYSSSTWNLVCTPPRPRYALLWLLNLEAAILFF